MKSIEPAQPLMLTRDQHATLGELVEIMGQIESLLIGSAKRVDPVAAKDVAKATGERQVKLWAKTVIGRIDDLQIAAVKQQIKEVAEDRNGFIHAIFVGDYAKPGYVEPGYQTTSARRNKTDETRSTDALQSVRDRAATLSCLINQIAGAIR